MSMAEENPLDNARASAERMAVTMAPGFRCSGSEQERRDANTIFLASIARDLAGIRAALERLAHAQ